MAYGFGQKIEADHYNEFVDLINEVYADTHSNSTIPAQAIYGYGQEPLQYVATGQKIRAVQWNALFHAIKACSLHLGLASGDTPDAVDIGNLIKAFSDDNTGLGAVITAIRDAKEQALSSKLVYSKNGEKLYGLRTNPWQGDLETEFEISFTSYDAARYFFNTGGKIRLKHKRSGGTVVQANTEMTTLLNTLGMLEFNHGETTSSNTLLPVNSIGFYDLNTSYQTIYERANTSGVTTTGEYGVGPYGLGLYSSGSTSAVSLYFKLEAKFVNTPPGTGEFKVRFRSTLSSGVDTINGNTSVEVDIATANGWLFNVRDPNFSPITTLSVGSVDNPTSASFTKSINGLVVDFTSTTPAPPSSTITEWYWDFGDDSTGTGATVSHTFVKKGVYTVLLRVTDSDGNITTSTSNIDLTEDRLPVVDFSFTTHGSTVNFTNESVPHTGATIASVLWDFDDSATSTSTPSVSHVYSVSDIYDVTLTVTDSNGLVNSLTKKVVVEAGTPRADFTYQVLGRKVVFSNFSNDPDGGTLTYGWVFGDATSSTDENPTHTYASNGAYAVTLTVTDDDGFVDTETKTITVTNATPVVDFTFSKSDRTVNFTSIVTDHDGSVADYLWDFGNGSASTDANPIYTYPADGLFVVVLTVTDDSAGTSSITKTVGVNVNGEPETNFTYVAKKSPAAYSGFGKTIAHHELSNITVIGAPTDKIDGAQLSEFYRTGSGSAYVYDGDVLIKALVPDDNDLGYETGYSVDMSPDGQVIAVGAPGAGSEEGAVYLFTLTNGVWKQSHKLQAADRQLGARFGHCVKFATDNSNTLYIGTPGRNLSSQTNVGAVYVFRKSTLNWFQQTVITPITAAAEAHFGTSIGINYLNNILVVGAPGYSEDYDRQGAAYVFSKYQEIWSYDDIILSDDPDKLCALGASVDISADGKVVVVGSPGILRSGYTSPSTSEAYIYQKVDGSWREIQRLVPSDRTGDELFGSTVSIGGDRIVIGAPNKSVGATERVGAVYVFDRVTQTFWEQKQKIQADDYRIYSDFGEHVKLSSSGARLFVGCPSDSLYEVNSGSVYRFNRTSVWSQVSKISNVNKTIVKFTNTSVDDGGAIVYNNWNFGDTFTSTLINPEHIFTTSGTYMVSLTCTDNAGAYSTKTIPVTIDYVLCPPILMDAICSQNDNVDIGTENSVTVRLKKVMTATYYQISVNYGQWRDITTVGSDVYYDILVNYGLNFNGQDSIRVRSRTDDKASVIFETTLDRYLVGSDRAYDEWEIDQTQTYIHDSISSIPNSSIYTVYSLGKPSIGSPVGNKRVYVNRIYDSAAWVYAGEYPIIDVNSEVLSVHRRHAVLYMNSQTDMYWDAHLEHPDSGNTGLLAFDGNEHITVLSDYRKVHTSCELSAEEELKEDIVSLNLPSAHNLLTVNANNLMYDLENGQTSESDKLYTDTVYTYGVERLDKVIYTYKTYNRKEKLKLNGWY